MPMGSSGSIATCCRYSSKPGFDSRLQVSQVNLQVPQVKQQALANAGPTHATRPPVHRTAKPMITNTASHQVRSLAVPNPQLMAATSQKHGIAVTLPRNGQFLGRPTPRDGSDIG